MGRLPATTLHKPIAGYADATGAGETNFVAYVDVDIRTTRKHFPERYALLRTGVFAHGPMDGLLGVSFAGSIALGHAAPVIRGSNAAIVGWAIAASLRLPPAPFAWPILLGFAAPGGNRIRTHPMPLRWYF